MAYIIIQVSPFRTNRNTGTIMEVIKITIKITIIEKIHLHSNEIDIILTYNYRLTYYLRNRFVIIDIYIKPYMYFCLYRIF